MTRSLLFFSAIACIAMASSAVSAFVAVREAISFSWKWLTDFSPIALKPKPKCKQTLVQANAYMTQQTKRDRPTVMARWRICPSV